MFNGKKSTLNLIDYWVELYSSFLLVVGLLVSLLSDAAIVSYIVILLCGAVVGRVYIIRKKKVRLSFYVAVCGFFIGYLIGIALNDRGYLPVVVVLFLAGIWAGKELQKKSKELE